MAQIIERKYLVKNMPELANLQPVAFERYYLFKSDMIEIRITRKNVHYELERYVKETEYRATTSRMDISELEFNSFKGISGEAISGQSYIISRYPEIKVKTYSARFLGLAIADVEFESEEQAKEFEPPVWLGKEVTNVALGRESQLVDLSNDDYQKLLNKYQ